MLRKWNVQSFVFLSPFMNCKNYVWTVIKNSNHRPAPPPDQTCMRVFAQNTLACFVTGSQSLPAHTTVALDMWDHLPLSPNSARLMLLQPRCPPPPPWGGGITPCLRSVSEETSAAKAGVEETHPVCPLSRTLQCLLTKVFWNCKGLLWCVDFHKNLLTGLFFQIVFRAWGLGGDAWVSFDLNQWVLIG